jgi:hypothetical protein
MKTTQYLLKIIYLFFEKILCRSSSSLALGKEYIFLKILCRVPVGWHSAKLGATATQCPALPSASAWQS